MAAPALYFIGAEGLDFVKVGRSTNPESRLRQLRAASPYKLRLLKVYPGSGDLEPYVLALLRARVPMNGEWFLRSDTDFETLVNEAQSQADAGGRPLGLPFPDDVASLGLGERIILARKAQGWKQKDLQASTGLSQTYLSQIEQGKVDPRFSIVRRIAKALGVSLDQLATEESPTADA